MTSDPDRQLERWLAETAEQLRPRHPGWARLVERLGGQETEGESLDADTLPYDPTDVASTAGGMLAGEKVRPDRGPIGNYVHRWRGQIAAAALLLVGLLVMRFAIWRQPVDEHGREDRGTEAMALWAPEDQPAFAATNLAVERRGIELTIFNPVEMPQPTLYMPLAANLNSASMVANGPAVQQLSGGFAPSHEPMRFQRGGRFGGPQPSEPQGLALVKDRRMILSLAEGDNLVKFTDVAATIDPTSVRLVDEHDLGAWQVVEQNFEFDLASADKVLERYVSTDSRVTCIGEEGESAGEGYLLAVDDDVLVLADSLPSDDPDAPRPKTESIRRANLKAVQVDKLPENLYVRPTLVWRLRTQKPGDHLALLTYLCGHVQWEVDYVVVVRESDPDTGDVLDLQAWVTVDNRSGTTYEDAGLKLIAGDVNRVPDPWAPVRARQLERMYFGAELMERAMPALDADEAPKEFVQREFFEYKLYELNQPSTIRTSAIKQLGLLKANDIHAKRHYVFDSNLGTGHAAVELVVKNSEENHLGRPLPKGRVIFTAVDADGDTHLIGHDEIDHTAKDEELELGLGEAFDVVGQYRATAVEQRGNRRTVDYEFTIRNHKDQAIDVRAVGHLDQGWNWTITKTSTEWTKHDVWTVYFDFRLEPNAERVITYTVQYDRR